MNNQAAQTMPELPRPALITERGRTGYTADQMHQYARDYAAALSQTAGEDASHERARLLVPVLKKSTEYWGVHHCASELKRAIEIIEDLLLAAAPAASGGEDYAKANPLGGPATMFDAIANRLRAGEPMAEVLEDYGLRFVGTAAASVSERGRSIITETIGYEFGTGSLQPVNDHDMENLAAAIEQALTQQRGEAVAWQMRSRYWDGAPWSEWRTYPSREAREADWTPYKGSEWLRETRELYTTPQRRRGAGVGAAVAREGQADGRRRSGGRRLRTLRRRTGIAAGEGWVMCKYQGYEFGAGRYPDSYCLDGVLHDADSDYLNEDNIPCPICNRQGAIDWWFHGWEGSCDVGDERPDDVINAEHMERAIGLVDDIRKNRGITDPNVTVHP